MRDGWKASLTWWTWVWASSGRWWRTGKPGVLQSIGSQRAGHGWATEQQQQQCEETLIFHARGRELKHGAGIPPGAVAWESTLSGVSSFCCPPGILQVRLAYFNPQLALASLEELQPQGKRCGKTPHPADNAATLPTQGLNPCLLHHSQILYRWATGQALLAFWSILLLHVVWPFLLLYPIKSQKSDFQLVKKLKIMHRVFYYKSNTPTDKSSVNSYGDFTMTESICFLVYLFIWLS